MLTFVILNSTAALTLSGAIVGLLGWAIRTAPRDRPSVCNRPNQPSPAGRASRTGRVIPTVESVA